jgi:hypothetical protein
MGIEDEVEQSFGRPCRQFNDKLRGPDGKLARLRSLEHAIDIGGRMPGAVAEGNRRPVSYRFFGRYSPKSIS